MNGRLTFETERDHPLMVVRPRGVLDAYTAPDLRATLLNCLADQPGGILIDATDLIVGDDVGLAVLATVAQQSARWPGARIVLASPTPDFAVAAERMGVTRHVPLCPDEAAARLELSGWPDAPTLRQRIEPDRNAPGLARTAVAEFCQAHGVGGDGDAAQLVASELVTNAVVHAGTSIDLTLRLVPPMLHIAVRDGADGQVRITGAASESAESGRGLLLVDALATAWGSLVPNSGKVVWATVKVRSRAPSADTGPEQAF
jgi:anti-anti-sigma factor